MVQAAIDTDYSEEGSMVTSVAKSFELFHEKWWRLNNLYWIIDKEGNRIKFKPNDAQRYLFENYWFMTLVLKARQLGFTTFIDLFILDECVFVPNLEAGIIAHTRNDAAKIFQRKIQYPYQNLPEIIKQNNPLVKDTQEEFRFANNSTISVGASMRSGTCHILHVSEFGKLCAKYPEKAREVVTGSMETVSPGQLVFVESTAEGRSGYFFDYCETAKKHEQEGRKLTKLDFKLLFFPWWRNPENTLDPEGVVVGRTTLEYFEKIEKQLGITLSAGQKAWYTRKKERLGDDMKREHPSTPDEPFEIAIIGSYFSKELAKAREDGRICPVPVQDGVLVDTWWDIGFRDDTSIWFTQTIGREIHVVDFYENSGEGLGHYADTLKEKDYRYGRHYGPHDLEVHEFGTGTTRIETAKSLGIDFTVIPRVQDKRDSIQAARNLFSLCWFDEEKCDKGLIHLEQYRKEWDERLGVYKNHPLHDEHSNGADAFQTLAMGHGLKLKRHNGARQIRPVNAGGWT